ncbi:MAG: isocitrate/isopropylmalate dehydrogenase family protein [Myxococcota bacterium]
MPSYRFTLLPGDGIGPEVTDAVVEILKACDLKIDWEVLNAGASVMDTYGVPLPKVVLDSIRRNRIALKGPITTPVGKGFTSVNVALRKALNLYASLRPVRSFPGVHTPWEGVDLVIVRENTEGLYSGLEHMVVPGVAVGVKMISREATTNIARFAFNYAKAEGRSKITVGHKAPVMALSDGLFIESVQAISEDYPFIEMEFLEADRVALQLAQDPSQFDVLLLENLFGDIFSDMGAGLVGGLGLVPGANIGDTCAVFEAVHGSAPDIAGQGKANPTALLLSAAMMLHYIGQRRQSERINHAVDDVLRSGNVRTGDIGGSDGTAEITQAFIDALPPMN